MSTFCQQKQISADFYYSWKCERDIPPCNAAVTKTGLLRVICHLGWLHDQKPYGRIKGLIMWSLVLKVLQSVSFFSRGQKVFRFKFSALFCQLSLNMLGCQQWLILLVEKDQQVLQMGKQ
jgi:hypothetical protein